MARPPLADEVFLFGHHERTGKLVVHAGTLDAALAGATVCELILASRVTAAGGRLAVVNGQPTGDLVPDAALAAMVRRGEGYHLREWISLLRANARRRVGQRMARTGLVTPVGPHSWRPGAAVRFRPVDETVALRPCLRLGYLMKTAQPTGVDAQSTALAVLVRSLRAEPSLALTVRREQVDSWIDGAARALAPDTRAVITAVDAAAEEMITGRNWRLPRRSGRMRASRMWHACVRAA